jgi:hypothetical protein
MMFPLKTGYRLEWLSGLRHPNDEDLSSGTPLPASTQPARAFLFTSPPEAPWKWPACPEQLFWMVTSLLSAP